MPPRPELLQLERNEDVASVRGRLLPLAGNRVLLVWPVRGSALTRRLDLVLVQREAQRLGVRLALLTQDPDVIRHARELSLSTFSTVGESERGRWKRGRARLSLAGRPEAAADTDDVSPRQSVLARAQAARQQPAPVLKFTGGLVLLLVVLVLAASAALLVLPEATVTILPARHLLLAEAFITADPEAVEPDLTEAIVPALPLSITVEESATLPPAGRQQLSATPASGTVVFVNLGADPVHIPVGTLVGTGGATTVWFHTTSQGTLAAGAGQQLELGIEAATNHEGPDGNVDIGFINTLGGDLASRVSVRNHRPTTGGSSQSVSIVQREDQERLLATVRQQIKSQAYISLLARLKDNQYLILETIDIATERSDWTRFSASPGEAARELHLVMKATVEAIAIDEAMAQEIVLDRLQMQVEAGSSLLLHTVNHDRGPVVSDFADGLVRFWRSAQGLAESHVDTATLRQQLVGLTSAEARAHIHQELALQPGTTPRINIEPAWSGRLPFLPLRIQIRLAEQA